MADRAQQALHLLALEPVAEMLADPNAYGFRPGRSAADAIAQCFNILARRNAARWILEGDIKACFDQISHEWLREHVPMDKSVLEKWLSAGYMEVGKIYPTEVGTPQGGLCSAEHKPPYEQCWIMSSAWLQGNVAGFLHLNTAHNDYKDVNHASSPAS